ncbi:MAG: amino acid permease [Leptospiraceae bacterium]|nr:amino acid permease [Leptospiraceae bacterium]MCK6382418.1 amino acid permease [Leptospiraceae bacterium]
MEFKRTLSLFDSVSLIFGTVIGSGIFFTSGFILSKVENPYLVLFLWILGGLVAIAGALTYSYPAILFPKAGGDYIYLKEAYNPFVGFLSGWISLLITFSATISALSLAFSKYLMYFFPENFLESISFQLNFIGLNIQFGSTQVFALLSVYTLSAIGYFGIQASFRIQNLLTVVKFGGLILFIFFGFIIGNKNYSFFSDPFLNTEKISFGNLLFGLIPITFSYFGWNMVTYIAGEIKDPKKNIPRAIVIACSLISLFYILINFLFLVSLPVHEMKSNEGIGIVSSKYLFGDKILPLLSFLFLWIILSSLSGIIIGGSRIYFALANDGLFFQSLAKLHPKYNSPYIAIFFQALYASIFIIIKDLESLVYFVTAGILFLSILTAASTFLFIKRKLYSEYKIPFYPFTPLFFIAINSAILGAIVYEKPVEALWGLGVFLLSIPVYFLYTNSFIKTLKRFLHH